MSSTGAYIAGLVGIVAVMLSLGYNWSKFSHKGVPWAIEGVLMIAIIIVAVDWTGQAIDQEVTAAPPTQLTLPMPIVSPLATPEATSALSAPPTPITTEKPTEEKYTDWSDWTILTYNPESPPEFGAKEFMILEDLGKTTVFDGYIYAQGDPVEQIVMVVTGELTAQLYKGYEYFSADGGLYAIKEGTEWKEIEKISLSEAPPSNLSVRYTFVETDVERTEKAALASGGYSSPTYFIWKKESREAGLVDTKSNTIAFPSGTVTFSQKEEIKVPLLSPITKVAGYERIRTAVYKDVYNYRRKLRSLIPV